MSVAGMQHRPAGHILDQVECSNMIALQDRCCAGILSATPKNVITVSDSSGSQRIAHTASNTIRLCRWSKKTLFFLQATSGTTSRGVAHGMHNNMLSSTNSHHSRTSQNSARELGYKLLDNGSHKQNLAS